MRSTLTLLCRGMAVALLGAVVFMVKMWPLESQKLIPLPASLQLPFMSPMSQNLTVPFQSHNESHTMQKQINNTLYQQSQPQQVIHPEVNISKQLAIDETRLTSPTLDKNCYKYHPNLTAENTCCQMVYFQKSPNLLRTCISRIKAELQMKNKNDIVHLVIVGDSHMRYLLAAFVTQFLSSTLQYRLHKEAKWEKGWILEHKLRKNELMHQHIEVRDTSISLHISFVWDKYLTIFPLNMTYWEENPQETPSLVILDGGLWWMLKTQKLYAKEGAKPAVAEYATHLRSLRFQLSLLAKRTTVIFKLIDDLLRTRQGPTQAAINTQSNYPLYNQAIMAAMNGTGVELWDSTLPMSRDYNNACDLEFRVTPPRYHWRCDDVGHVGYILVEQYSNMILNHFCNRYLNLTTAYCLR